MTVQTLNIPPYGQTRIEPGQTLAFMNGDVPHLFVRVGSEAIRLPQGHSVPVEANSAYIINPFPRPCEVMIARGLPINYTPEATELTAAQRINCTSQVYRRMAPPPAGNRYGAGLIMKRGRALLQFDDKLEPTNSRVIIFRGASPDFLDTKPPEFMPLAFVLRYLNLEPDTAIQGVLGPYTVNAINAWIAASGFSGEIIENLHDPKREYLCTAGDAVFFVRYNSDTTGGFDGLFTCRHLGDDLGNYN